MKLDRRLRKRVDRARAALRGPDGSEERVHEARRQIKRARALLSLGRGGARARRQLRKAARALAAPRDAAILGAKGAPVPGDAERRLEKAARALPRMRPGVRALARRARRLYRKALSRRKESLRHPDDETLHAWRKSAKAVAALISELEAPSGPLRALRERLDALGKILGEDHDLVVRRSALREKAAKLAAELEAPSPKKFEREFRRSLRAG